MANVSFKRGPAANLATAGFSAQDGVFYLTTDTHRLYVGQDSELVDLNRYIKYVDTQNDLASSTSAVGDFAFVADGNMLLVYTGSAWTQINAQDGNDVSRVSSITTPVVTSSAEGITVSFSVNQTITSKDSTSKADGEAIPVSFQIKASDLTTANNVAVGLAATTNSAAGVDLATSGDGATGNKINIKGGDNASVALSNGAIVVSAKDTTYTLGGTKNNIQIVNNDGTTQNLPVVSGAKISATVADNKLTIAHTGLAAAAETKGSNISLDEGNSFKVVTGITAADGHVTGYTTQQVTVPDYSDTQYSMEVAASGANTEIILIDNNDDKSTVTLKPSTDMVITPDTDAGSVTVAHKTYGAVSNTLDSSKNESATYEGSFTVVDSVSTNNGHVTGVTTKKITMPSQLKDGIAAVEVSANASGDVSVKVTDENGGNATGKAEGALYMTVNGTKVYNQGVIDFYTKDEINAKINGIDAMRYKGTVGGTGATVSALPSSGVAIGDTYMVAASGTYGSHSCDVGDLLIATGTETNGVITSGLAWTYVPAGDDTDTQFTLNVADNTITLKNANTGDGVGSAKIAAGSKISVSTSGSTITVAHAGLAAPTASTAAAETPAHGGSFTVLDSITAADGHVTGYATKKITLPTVQSTKGSLGLADGHKIHYSDAAGDSDDVTLANDSYITLTDDLTSDKLTIGHKSYNTPLAATTDTAASLSHGGKFTVVTEVARDSGGHLTSYKTKEYTLPSDNNTTYSLSTEESGVIKLTGSNGISTTATIKAGTAVGVSSSATGITINHSDVSHTSTTATAEAPAAGNKITVVKSVSVNSQGHTTDVKTVDITLPTDKDTTFSMSSAVSAVAATTTTGAGAKLTATLTDSNSTNKGNANLTITSQSLNVAAGTNAMTIDLEWGTF